MNDITAQLYRERFSIPVRGRNSMQPQQPDTDAWAHLKALRVAGADQRSNPLCVVCHEPPGRRGYSYTERVLDELAPDRDRAGLWMVHGHCEEEAS